MKRRSSTPKSPTDKNTSKSTNSNNPLNELFPRKEPERGAGLRRERPGTGEWKLSLSNGKDDDSDYDYTEDRSILREELIKLRKEHPEASILKIPHYPLYSSKVTIYKLKNKNKPSGDFDE